MSQTQCSKSKTLQIWESRFILCCNDSSQLTLCDAASTPGDSVYINFVCANLLTTYLVNDYLFACLSIPFFPNLCLSLSSLPPLLSLYSDAFFLSFSFSSSFLSQHRAIDDWNDRKVESLAQVIGFFFSDRNRVFATRSTVLHKVICGHRESIEDSPPKTQCFLFYLAPRSRHSADTCRSADIS